MSSVYDARAKGLHPLKAFSVILTSPSLKRPMLIQASLGEFFIFPVLVWENALHKNKVEDNLARQVLFRIPSSESWSVIFFYFILLCAFTLWHHAHFLLPSIFSKLIDIDLLYHRLVVLSTAQTSIHQPVCTTALMTLASLVGGSLCSLSASGAHQGKWSITCCCSGKVIELQALSYAECWGILKFISWLLLYLSHWLVLLKVTEFRSRALCLPCSFSRRLACQGRLCHLIEYSLDVEWKLYSRQTSKLTDFKVSYPDFCRYCPHGKVCLKTQF